jgi:hypothetical protein
LVDKFVDDTIINPHLTINDYINIYGDEILSYFWFCVIRNPFDRIVSEYFYSVYKKLTTSSFDRFIQDFEFKSKTYKNHELRQIDFVKNNKKEFDFIGRFENLNSCFSEISNRLNISNNFPHTNKTNHLHYKEYYSENTYNIVSEYYKEDLSHFGYIF